VGGATDYSNALRKKQALQATSDLAVLAGIAAGGGEAAIIGVANTFFEANLNEQQLSGLDHSVAFNYDGNVLSAIVTAKSHNTILPLIGVDAIALSVRAGATASYNKAPLCILTLHPTRAHTLEMRENVKLLAPDCHIYGNSSHPFDVVDLHSINNAMVGKTVQANGYGHHYIENVSPPLVQAGMVIPDPLSALPMPSTTEPCDFSGTRIKAQTVTLDPGVYCGGLRIESGSNVTLKPGLYKLRGGNFIVDGSTVSGTDVTVALTDKSVEIEWIDAEVHFDAPRLKTSNNMYQSIAVVGFRDSNPGTVSNHFIEDSVVNIHGVVYVPNGDFVWVNDGGVVVDHKWTAWIVDGFSWEGSGELYFNFQPQLSDIPYPATLVTIPQPGTKVEFVTHKKWTGEVLVWDGEGGQPRLVF
jgi:hypothetical protein